MARACFFSFVCRVVVAAHFLSELYDKINRFSYWSKQVEKSSLGLGDWSMMLVVGLLGVGCTLLVLGKGLPLACFCLVLFQVPTSLYFENFYDQMDSLSAVGGVLAVMFLSREVGIVRRQKKELEYLSDININGDSFSSASGSYNTL
jgi:uncharacterized membrane protein YphA (DoxX/SURF4 family)